MLHTLHQAVPDPANEMELVDLPSAPQAQSPPVVYIRNACKHYGSKSNRMVVLDRLDMTVPKGTIYGLLGSSGCGKTTLLNCILGQTSVNSGDIWALGGPPGSKSSGIPGPRVGYMPQEISLYGDFTIHETFKYFGWIAGMGNKEIKERFEMLTKLFMLPETGQRVGTLSGGQQRRLSLASAIFYGPDLLLLDEPTVGVDPVLRENIWNYLIYISREEKTTIIITTHYIEEARQADIVGLMRGGKLLAEKSPEALLRQYGSQTLEEVFLKLSTLQSVDVHQQVNMAYSSTPGSSSECIAASSSVNDLSKNCDVKNQSSVSPVWQHNKTSVKTTTAIPVKNSWCRPLFKGNHMKALIWKNWMWWIRNPATLAYVIGLSVVLILLFCYCVGQEPRDLHVAVVNYETNNTFNCAHTLTCNSTELSCNYLEKLKEKSIILTYYDSEDEATASVYRGDSYAAIVMKHNYSAALRVRVKDWVGSGRWNRKYSTIDIVRDASNRLVADYIKLHVYDAFRDFFQDYVGSCDFDPKSYNTPIRMGDPVYGTEFPVFADFAIPGTFLTVNLFLSILLTSGAMLSESQEGSFGRTFVLGITEIELIAAHIVCEFVIMLVQTALLLTTTFCVFDITLNGSLTLVILLTVLAGICGMCFGIFISCICGSYLLVNSVAMGTFFPIMVLSGIIWPLQAVHRYLKPITIVLPLTYGTESMRNILQKNWGMSSFSVYMGFVTIGTWALIFLIFSIVSLKYRIQLKM